MAGFWDMDKKIAIGASLVASTGLVALASFKLCRSRQKEVTENVYETQKLLHEYLVFHYGSPTENLRFDFGPKDSVDFPKRCADLCLRHYKPKEGLPNRALDVGCAVGRSTFELTRQFEEVLGIDYSKSFVDACNTLKDQGRMSYFMSTEGDLVQNLEARISPELVRSRADFQQGDACNLPLDLGQFSCVLAANLICRLHNPKIFLARAANLVAPGGILVITSPYTFLTEYTPKENMIGGYRQKNGKELSAFEGLRQELEDFFDLEAEENMPFLIRETARKHQWTVAHTTVWRRKDR